MKPKKKILAFCNYYLPGFRGGGPIRTIANMVDALSDDFEFQIFTGDRDLGDERPYSDIRVDEWNRVGAARVFYASPSMQTTRGVLQLLRGTAYDVLYLNSYFSPTFSIKPLIVRRLGLLPHRPVVLAPRGEFSPAAFGLKRWKKRLFSSFATSSGLHDGVLWHASTEHEAADTKHAIGGKRSGAHSAISIVVAPDMLNALPRQSAPPAATDANDGAGPAQVGPLRVCFLSRISRMKNLSYALQILAETQVPVHFDIYGPIEDSSYWAECSALIATLPSHVIVEHQGVVEHRHVLGTLETYDLFFVPSLGENFGHVFYESFAAGTPVLTSDKTAWRNLRGLRIGWDLPLDEPSAFAAALEEAHSWTRRERNEIRDRCSAFAHEQLQSSATIDLNRALFESVLSRGHDRP